MLPFPLQKQLILACHITGVHDVNRNNTLPDNDFSIVKDWADSISKLGLQGILFHNNFSDETCLQFQSEVLQFIRINPNPLFNPNVYRYIVYNDFLNQYHTQIESLFVTDVADVVAVCNPFEHSFFLENPNVIFCGSEPTILNIEWMQAHSTHFRLQSKDFAAYEEQFKNETLLNCGIIGGQINMMKVFIEKLSEFHQQYNTNNTTQYTGDMGAFNYMIHTQFNKNFLHGWPINTVFKQYQTERNDCWFRHK